MKTILPIQFFLFLFFEEDIYSHSDDLNLLIKKYDHLER